MCVNVCVFVIINTHTQIHTHFLYFAERQENTSKGIVNTGKGDSE